MADHLQDELLRRPIAPTETLPASWLEAFLSGAGDLASGVYNHPRETLGGFVEGAKGPAKRVASRLGENALGLAKTALTPPTDTAAEMGKNLAFTSPSDYPAEGVKLLTGVDPREDFPEMSADALTGALLARGLSGGSGRGSGSNGRPNTPPVHNVPAELEGFRPSGHEFNEPALRPELPPEELAKLKELTSPAAARNRGSYDPPHDGSLPKHKDVIPPFRSKSGMAVDVMDELKKSKTVPPPPTDVPITEAQWQKFTADPQQAIMDDPFFAGLVRNDHEQYHKLWQQRGKSENQLEKFAKSAVGPQPEGIPRANLVSDPVDYVANTRSLDEMGMENPTFPLGAHTDKLIQKLSNFFASAKHDPSPYNNRSLVSKIEVANRNGVDNAHSNQHFTGGMADPLAMDDMVDSAHQHWKPYDKANDAFLDSPEARETFRNVLNDILDEDLGKVENTKQINKPEGKLPDLNPDFLRWLHQRGFVPSEFVSQPPDVKQMLMQLWQKGSK